MAVLSFALHATVWSLCFGHRMVPHFAAQGQVREGTENSFWWLMNQIFNPSPATTTTTTTTATTTTEPGADDRRLRRLADAEFRALHSIDADGYIYQRPGLSVSGQIGMNRTGGDSIFEQTRQFMRSNQHAWYANWAKSLSVNFLGEDGIDARGLRKEWIQLNLESAVAEEKPSEKALECLKFNKCANSTTPQMLLEPLISGELIPILDYEQAPDAQRRGSR